MRSDHCGREKGTFKDGDLSRLGKSPKPDHRSEPGRPRWRAFHLHASMFRKQRICRFPFPSFGRPGVQMRPSTCHCAFASWIWNGCDRLFDGCRVWPGLDMSIARETHLLRFSFQAAGRLLPYGEPMQHSAWTACHRYGAARVGEWLGGCFSQQNPVDIGHPAAILVPKRMSRFGAGQLASGPLI